MSSTKSLLSLHISSILSIETFLEMISKDYKLPEEELKKRYLYDNKKSFNKIIKKFKQKKPRKIHSYNIFLSDNNILSHLKDKQIKNNTEKAKLWKKIKNNPNQLQKYKNISTLENKGLLEKKYRNNLLSNWEKYDKQISKIINSKNIDWTLSKVLNNLKLDII